MKKTHFVLLLLSTLLVLSAFALSQVYSGDYAVIVNPNNPVQNISSTQLRKIVLGDEKFWTGRIPVSLILQNERAVEHDFVLRRLVNMTQGDYKEHWSTLVFRGVVASEPLTVPSNGLASGLVQSQIGAVCIMRIDNVPKSAVKVLRVDGKLPGEDGYPLH